MSVQRALLKMFRHPPSASVSLLSPLVYADRLRIRHPGDAKFALGPHIDGGSGEMGGSDVSACVSEDLEGELGGL